MELDRDAWVTATGIVITNSMNMDRNPTTLNTILIPAVDFCLLPELPRATMAKKNAGMIHMNVIPYHEQHTKLKMAKISATTAKPPVLCSGAVTVRVVATGGAVTTTVVVDCPD